MSTAVRSIAHFRRLRLCAERAVRHQQRHGRAGFRPGDDGDAGHLSPPANMDDDGACMMTDELGNGYCYADLILYRLDGTSWTALKTIPRAAS